MPAASSRRLSFGRTASPTSWDERPLPRRRRRRSRCSARRSSAGSSSTSDHTDNKGADPVARAHGRPLVPLQRPLRALAPAREPDRLPPRRHRLPLVARRVDDREQRLDLHARLRRSTAPPSARSATCSSRSRPGGSRRGSTGCSCAAIWFDLIVPALALLLVGGRTETCARAPARRARSPSGRATDRPTVILAFDHRRRCARARRRRPLRPRAALAPRQADAPARARAGARDERAHAALCSSSRSASREFSERRGGAARLMALAAFARRAVRLPRRRPAQPAGALGRRRSPARAHARHADPGRARADAERPDARHRVLAARDRPVRLGRRQAAAEGTATAHVTLVEHAGRPTAALLHDPMLERRAGARRGDCRRGRALARQRAPAGEAARADRVPGDDRQRLAVAALLARPRGPDREPERGSRLASGYEDEEEVRWQPFWDVFVSPEEREGSRTRFEDAAPFHKEAGVRAHVRQPGGARS